jgi:hypothetical protein
LIFLSDLIRRLLMIPQVVPDSHGLLLGARPVLPENVDFIEFRRLRFVAI